MPKFSREAYPVNSIVYERCCPYCNAQFWGNKPSATYCSDKCRVYAGKQRRAWQTQVLEAYAQDPAEAQAVYGPVLVEKEGQLQLLYYNPIDEELKQLDGDGTFALEHVTRQVVQPLEKVFLYHTLRMKHHRHAYHAMRKLLEEEQAQHPSKLTARQRTFLKSELAKTDEQIMALHAHLQRLRSADEKAFNW
jgi:hypothetical protein